MAIISILVMPTLKAEVPDTACDLVYQATNNVESGNGGQDYVTNIQMSVYNSDLVGGPKNAGNFDIYDWNGELVESIYGDYELSMNKQQSLTGYVDGTYTYILDGTYKGTFNVNHEMQAIVAVDMAYYNGCNHDAYGKYIDPNSIPEYDSGIVIQASSNDSDIQSMILVDDQNIVEESEDTFLINNEVSLNTESKILIFSLIMVLTLIVFTLVVLIFTLKKMLVNNVDYLSSMIIVQII